MRARAVILVTAALLLAACGSDGSDGGDGVDGTDATTRLEAQRDEVRSAAADLLDGAEETLGGRADAESGTYDGCDSLTPEGFRNFRYVAKARVAVDPAAGVAEPYVEALQPALEQAGFSVAGPTTAANGFVSVTGSKGDLTTGVTHTGAGPFVLVTVSGPCVDVPKDDWPDWLARKADTSLR